jgi:FixJ family two-component response regulator
MFEASKEIAHREHVFAAFHTTDLSRRQSEFLTLLTFGLSDDEISEIMGIALETVRRHSHEARMRVIPPEFEPTRANAQYWASKHLSDCLAPAFLAIRGLPA